MIDSHVHITLPEQKVLHHRLFIDEYSNEIMKIGGGQGIVFLNPFDDKYCCPNSFKDNKLHRSFVQDISETTYSISCERCNTIHYMGEDVFRSANVKLLELANGCNMRALAFLTASSLSIQHQVDYYEKNHPSFLGYKIHPTITMYPADGLQFSSKKTVVFHSGNDKYASPKQIVEFARNYSGNVVIAHFARFDISALKEISDMSNVWVDMSPFTFLFGLIQSRPEQLFDTHIYGEQKDNIRKMFDFVASCVGLNKILFASDAPFGNLSDEKQFLDSLDLKEADYKRITEENAEKAFLL